MAYERLYVQKFHYPKLIPKVPLLLTQKLHGAKRERPRHHTPGSDSHLWFFQLPFYSMPLYTYRLLPLPYDNPLNLMLHIDAFHLLYLMTTINWLREWRFHTGCISFSLHNH
ncbi:hypothetical protein HanHA300_Chr07g0251581 [Helianthus annuus]|nr:hypothetical protein HanHA300_Chr07g0251581 [Helianthus annuus]KAJ0563907.1 hypothetical protein HanHA89_Chr07g0268341 [Helianthus annuus]KAJ0731983.1 hypothetical protein HanOQP8_Chr07g0258081 [Helianthus annuus]